MPRWVDRVPNIAVVLVLLASVLLVVVRLRPAPPAGIDEAYIRTILGTVAAEPHPAASEANDRVRDFLADELSRLGYDVTRQPGLGENWRTGVKIPIENVIGRMAGTDDTGHALLLCAHFDSRVGGSHGAADDGAGVAAVMEAARQLAADRPRNDVVILLTDGEEAGLLGAIHWALETAPEFMNARVALNFEARGSGGSPILFETGRNSGGLLDDYAAVAERPAASSLADAVYSLMPNATDFTVLKYRPGDLPERYSKRFPAVSVDLAGLNFAFLDRYHTYHTPDDNLASLDINSVFESAGIAAGLARRLGHADLASETSQHDRVFFDVASFGVVRYPTWLAWPLVGVAGLCVTAGIWRRRAALHRRGLLVALGGAVVLPVVLASILGRLLPHPEIGRAYPLVWATLLVSVAVVRRLLREVEASRADGRCRCGGPASCDCVDRASTGCELLADGGGARGGRQFCWPVDGRRWRGCCS